MSDSIDSSLTTPCDKTQDKLVLSKNPPLTEKETTLAMNELLVSDFVNKFPRVERRYADPPSPLQTYGLISFIPAKGATPNEKGIYGFAKLRGNFATPVETDQQAEKLIKEVDSYHKIYTTYVGRPFPLTLSSDYSKETTEVDMRKDIQDTVSFDIKSKREKEEREMKEIKDREAQLKEDVSRDQKDPEYQHDLYTTLRVKKAQLSWTFLENEKKLQEVKEIIIKTRKELEELESENPEYRQTYFQKYVDARSKAGLRTDEKADNFIKYMLDDADLGF
jgi:hypothetical protein